MTHTKTLKDLYSKHTGYASDKWELYLSEYQRLFSPLRDAPLRLLEIGIQNGGSLEIWKHYFLQAQLILGCDINPACTQLVYDNETIQLVIGDINQTETLIKIVAYSTQFDIIIDDGSHTSSDIVQSFCNLFPLLGEGGIYVVEDLHCSYWTQFEGGLFHPRSSISFFKAMTDILNFEHWGFEKTRKSLLQPFGITPELSEKLLAELHSIEFINSMCIIRKRPANQNTLGTRHVVGRLELVSPVKQVAGTYCQSPPQQTIDTASFLQSADTKPIQSQNKPDKKDHLITSLLEKIRALEATQHKLEEDLFRAKG
jgi:hypothetical protein